tara:strand:- start:119 stop:487 length:369 start_codon:yes stop_codon:yes gene_type:complete
MIANFINIIIFIFLIVFSFLTIFAFSFDVHLLIKGFSPEFTSIGQFWYELSPSSLQISEVIISRYIDPCSLFLSLGCNPILWHPFISSILILPATPIFLFLFLLFFWFYRVYKEKKAKLYFK